MVVKLRYKNIGIISLFMFSIVILFVLIKTSTSEVDAISINNQAIKLPIILYHEIKPKVGKYSITPSEFESDLKYLSENKYTPISMTELINYVNNDDILPSKPIIISFDDGYLNDYVYVFPLLKKYHVKMVFSIIGKSTDDFSNKSDINLDYSHVTWDQLNEMIGSGYVEVQNHTYNLHVTRDGRIGCMQKSTESLSHYEKVLSDDIGKLQEEITLKTGETPNTFTYPYGRFSKNTDPILKKMGFKATLSSDYGVNLITKDAEGLFDLKRISRYHGQGLEKIITEALKTLKH